MKSIQPILKGSELFNDYGLLPRSDLLRRYGYITDNYAKYDVVEIPLDLVVETAKRLFYLSDESVKRQLNILEEADALDDGYDISHAEEGVEQFSLELKMLGLVLIPHFSPKFAKQASRGELPKPWFTFMRNVVNARMEQYKTTINEDCLELDNLRDMLDGGMHEVNPRQLRRRIAALQVRIGEKSVLESALAWLAKKEHISATEAAEQNGKKRGAEDERGQGSNKRR
jgi:SET domain-containing protein 6